MNTALPRLPFNFAVRELVTASRCQWEFACFLEYLLQADDTAAPFDWHLEPLAGRIGELGRSWETQVLDGYYRKAREEKGSRTTGGMSTVVDLESTPREHHRDAFYAGLRDGVSVFHNIYVASDNGFSGRIPFIAKTDEGFMVQMSKFGAHVHPDTLIYLGFYVLLARELLPKNTPISASISLSSGQVSDVDADQVADDAASVLFMVAELIHRRKARGEMIDWRNIRDVCGRCWFCEQEIQRTNDVFAVAGVGARTREILYEHHIFTVEDLAKTDPTNLPFPLEQPIITQAKAQYIQQTRRKSLGHDDYVYAQLKPHVKGVSRQDGGPGLSLPGPGDVYFDFEIDNLRRGRPEDRYGLVYLAGLVGVGISDCWALRGLDDDAAPPPQIPEKRPRFFTPRLQPQPAWQATSIFPIKDVGDFADLLGMDYVPLWAHDYAHEKEMFIRMMMFLLERKKLYPDMRIYHYSHHEPVLVRRLARRHGVYEDEARELFQSSGVFVDLFNAVKSSVITGQGGYSLKDMEPLYCGGIERDEKIAAGDDSIIAYNRLREAMLVHTISKEESTTIKQLSDTLAMYNEYDCCSMVLLHQWLMNFISAGGR